MKLSIANITQLRWQLDEGGALPEGYRQGWEKTCHSATLLATNLLGPVVEPNTGFRNDSRLHKGFILYTSSKFYIWQF